MKKRNVVLLDAFRDDNTGEIGLGIAGLRRDETTNAAVDGVLLAHDLIEHVNGPEAIGTIDDELEALGAIWYVRGQHADLSRNGVGSRYSPEQNIASDVSRMFRDFFYGQHVTLACPRTLATDEDDAFREIIALARKEALQELDEDEREKQDTAEMLAAYTRVCLPRMRIGYRKAKRKYEPHGRWFGNSLFWLIADAVEPYCKHAEEGMQYQLVYGIREGSAFAQCEEYYGEDY